MMATSGNPSPTRSHKSYLAFTPPSAPSHPLSPDGRFSASAPSSTPAPPPSPDRHAAHSHPPPPACIHGLPAELVQHRAVLSLIAPAPRTPSIQSAAPANRFSAPSHTRPFIALLHPTCRLPPTSPPTPAALPAACPLTGAPNLCRGPQLRMLRQLRHPFHDLGIRRAPTAPVPAVARPLIRQRLRRPHPSQMVKPSRSLSNSPSSKFHNGRQYCPVDSMAMSVTRQFFSQGPANCLRSRGIQSWNLRLRIFAPHLSNRRQHAHAHTVLMDVDAAASAIDFLHDVL